MRLYLPLTLPRLAALHRAGEVGPAPLSAYAVTPQLRSWYGADGGEEELEYAALGWAALASLRLLASGPAAPPRRVVLAADAPTDAVSGTGSPLDRDGFGAVQLSRPLPRSLAAAVHLDAADAEPDVAKAIAALDAADRGDAEARGAVEDVEDHELLWYGVQEIDALL